MTNPWILLLYFVNYFVKSQIAISINHTITKRFPPNLLITFAQCVFPIVLLLFFSFVVILQ